jgi:hypothetical protein
VERGGISSSKATYVPPFEVAETVHGFCRLVNSCYDDPIFACNVSFPVKVLVDDLAFRFGDAIFA